jgi:hypothetical protein
MEEKELKTRKDKEMFKEGERLYAKFAKESGA